MTRGGSCWRRRRSAPRSCGCTKRAAACSRRHSPRPKICRCTRARSWTATPCAPTTSAPPPSKRPPSCASRAWYRWARRSPDTVAPGQAVGISTGGFLPDGADAVVMIEHTRGGDAAVAGVVEILRALASGANVIQRGDDVTTGAALIPAGRRLRPQDIAALATFGAASLTLYRRPRIAVLSTGNEICAVDATPAPGQVRDVNEWVLGAQVELAGAGRDLRRRGARRRGRAGGDDRAPLAGSRRRDPRRRIVGRRQGRVGHGDGSGSTRRACSFTASTSVPASRRSSRASAPSR